MKKFLISFFLIAVVIFHLSAQVITEKEPVFNGTSAEAAAWINQHDRLFRSIARNVNKVIAYYGTTKSSGKNVTILFYDYNDVSKGQIGTVLEIIENSTGNTIFVVWTNEARGSNAVFFNDSDKNQLDVSVASRGRKYGMSNDTLKFVRTIIKEL